MAILKAVYKSADRFKTPDNRYGYGIPNMRKAYNILLKQRNQQLYKDEWLIAGNTNFTDEISFKLIAKSDGLVTVNLLDNTAKVIAKTVFTTEADEVYDRGFKGLNNLPAGAYSLQYNDGINAKTIQLNK